jgi:hypothetical protein
MPPRLYEEATLEMLRHLEDAEVCKLGHWHAAAAYETWHRYFIAVPAIIASALLTWLLMSPLDGLLTGPAAVFLKTGAPRLLALVVTILTGLDLFLGFKGLAAAHRNAALSYQEVWRHCKNWRTDFPDEAQAQQAAEAAKQYRDRLNSINRNSPQLPKWAWRSVSRQRLEGSVSYAFELREGPPNEGMHPTAPKPGGG